jgi:hypothetical protein
MSSGPVRTPEDFVEKLQEKIESGSTIQRLFRALFVPVWTKIPLEAAAAAAVVILIVAVWQTPQQERQLALAPEGGEQIRLAKKATVKRLKSEIEEEPSTDMAAPEEAPLEQPRKDMESSDLALLMEAESDKEGYPPSSVTPEAQGPEFLQAAGEPEMGEILPTAEPQVEHEFRREEMTELKETGEEHGAAAKSARERRSIAARKDVADRPLKRIEALMKLGGGRILSVDQDEQNKQSSTILVEIPAEQYERFSSVLEDLGSVKTFQPTPLQNRDGFVRVRIHLVLVD